MVRRLRFLTTAVREMLRGDATYRWWLVALTVGALVGVWAYVVQLRDGLYVTNMTDQVSWGIYIANFTFAEGVAAAAVMVVIPAYVYKVKAFREIVFVGETLAICAVLVCLLFVTVDLGRPERAWHLIPMLGSLNFPVSILAWDVVVLSGYFFINVTLVMFALRSKYLGRAVPRAYVPLLFTSMLWAVGVYTVSAFLYTWLGARPFWNSAIIAPRFVASALVSGPAIVVLVLRVIQRRGSFAVDAEVFTTLRKVISVTLLISLFLFASEVFTELYGGSPHNASMKYLLFGHHDHDGLRFYLWTGLSLELVAATLLLTRLARKTVWLDTACVAVIIGVWIEKGMALVVPGFIPTPLGEFVEYVPSVIELLVTIGVWCIGLLVFSLLLKLGIGIETGRVRHEDEGAT